MTSTIFSLRLSRTSKLSQVHVKEERVLQYLENAVHAAERGGKLTNQLLAFSRRHDLLTEPVDVNHLISETCEMLPRTIGPTITIDMALEADVWPAMTVAGQLELAILNLAINARDAMLAGGKLTISTTKVARGDRRRLPRVDPGDYVMISVADTGTGMSEQVRNRAFEPFFATKEAGKGTGLGLSMVYGFVHQSGGTVTIDSVIGKGTTFPDLFAARPASIGRHRGSGRPKPAERRAALSHSRGRREDANRLATSATHREGRWYAAALWG